MYIARLTVVSESCVVPLETAGNVMELYANVVIIDNHSLDIEIDELSSLRQCAIEKLEDFKSEFGESEIESDSLYDHTWGNIILSVMFDHETGEASSIILLDTDYPHSL